MCIIILFSRQLYLQNCSESTGKDKTLKDLENDIAALENRIKSLDTEVTPTYTDDNIHGDTPTPTRQLSIVSQTHEGVSESCGQLLKKLDIVQIGFVQIQTQNKQMVKLVDSSFFIMILVFLVYFGSSNYRLFIRFCIL